MVGNLGNIQLNLVLNIEPFKNQMQTVLNFIRNLQTTRIGDLSPDPTGIKQLEAALQKTVEQTNQLNKGIEKTSSTSKKSFGDIIADFKNFFVLTTTAYLNLKQLVTPIIDFGKESVAAFEKAEISLAKLRNGLKNVGEDGTGAFERLTRQAEELQKITPFADEDIINAQAMLTTFMKSSDEIEILTPRMLDLAAAFQTSGDSSMSLQQIAVMLGKVNEETIGTLRRVGVAFTEEQAEKLKSLRGTEQAIYLSQILDQNFKGMAETIGNTFAGRMKILSNAWDDVKEKIGGAIAGAFMPLAKIVQEIIPVVDSFIQEIIAFYKEFANAVSQIMGGKVTFDELKAGIVDLIQSALSRLLQYLRDIEPAYLAMVASVKKLIPENFSLIDVLKKVVGVIFDVITALVKWNSAVITVVADIAGWFRSLGDTITGVMSSIWNWFASIIPDTWVNSIKSAIQTVMGWMRELAQNPVMRILFPALNLIDTGIPQQEIQLPQGEMGPPKPPGYKQTITTTTKTLTGTGKSQTDNEEEKLNLLQEEQKKLEELQKQLEKNKGIKGAELEILKQIEKTQERILFLQTGERPISKIIDELAVGKQIEDIKKELSKRSEEIALNQKKIDDEIYRKKIAMIEDEFVRRRQEINLAYKEELDRINELKDASEEQRNILRDIANKKKAKELQLINEQELLTPFYGIKSIAEQIQGIFSFGSHTVFYNFVRALQITEQIIALFRTIDAVGGIFKFLGAIFGFIFGGPAGAAPALAMASGGVVPGSGNRDSVPALLTPGEYVIRKPIVQQLGIGFLNMLNGYITNRDAMFGRYNAGGLVAAGVNRGALKLEVDDIKINGNDLYISWKRTNQIVNKRNK